MSRPKKEPTTTRPIRIPVKLNDQLSDINVSKICGQFLDYQVNSKLGTKKVNFIINLLKKKSDSESDPARKKTIMKITDVLSALLNIGNDSELPKKQS